MSFQVRRMLRIVITILVVAIVLNDAIRFGSAYTRVINASREGLDAAGTALLTARNPLPPARDAIVAKGAVLAAYESKRDADATSKMATVRMIVRTEAPGMIVLGPIMNAAAGVPAGEWWSTPVVVDWPANRTVNLTTGMTIN